jgi:hypothetical protein
MTTPSPSPSQHTERDAASGCYHPHRSLVGIIPEITALANRPRPVPQPANIVVMDDYANRWRCTVCNDRFWDMDDANRHISNYMTEHMNICTICDVDLGSRRVLNDHFDMYHRRRQGTRYYCRVCPFVTNKLDEFDRHTVFGHGLALRCGHRIGNRWYGWRGCEEKFATKKARDAHAGVHHSDAIKCPGCEYHGRQGPLKLHMAATGHKPVAPPAGPRRPPQYDPMASLVGVLPSIKRNIENEYFSGIMMPTWKPPGNEPASPRSGVAGVVEVWSGYRRFAWDDMPANETAYMCVICNHNADSEEEARAHAAGPCDQAICHICDYITDGIADAKEHTEIYHEQSRYLPFACHLCPEQLDGQRPTDRHLKWYHQWSTITCSVRGCYADFGTRAERLKHMRAEHPDVLLEYCSEPGCNKGFKTWCAMQEHQRRDHPGRLFDAEPIPPVNFEEGEDIVSDDDGDATGSKA